jgi:hypothetical protein
VRLPALRPAATRRRMLRMLGETGSKDVRSVNGGPGGWLAGRRRQAPRPWASTGNNAAGRRAVVASRMTLLPVALKATGVAVLLGAIGLVTPSSADAASTSAAPAAATSVAAASVRGARGAELHAAPALPGVGDCKNPPTPELPGRGVVGFFESPPSQPPAPGDPFAAGSQTSIHEQYGYSGLRFNTYDLGCGVDMARSPDATVGTTMANWVLTFPKTLVAATGALLGAAYQPEFLSVFDPLVSNVVDGLRRTVFDQWAAVVVVAMGFLIIWRARKAPLASTTAAIGWALLVMMIATVLFRWPVAAGQVADQSVSTTLATVSGGLNGHGPDGQAQAGHEATANLHEALLYKAWLGGTFGDANAEVAQKYGPKIFDAQALTWSQAQTLQTDPAQGQRIIAAKQQEFKDAATAVQAEDPDAYEYLVGRRSDSRVGYSMLAAVAALCAVPFLIMSALLVIGALVIVRFGVMLFPAFATLGLFPTMRHLIIGIGNTMAAAVINALIFGIGSAVMVKGMGVVLDPATGLPPWLDVILVLVLTIVMWAALSPFRRLTRMVAPGHDPFRHTTTGIGRLGRGAARVGGRAAGAALTGFVAGRTARDGYGEVPATADDHLQTATRRANPTRAEAGGPAYGSISVPSSVLPPVPADPAPEGARSGYSVLSAGPSGVSSSQTVWAAETGQPAPRPAADVPPTPRGWPGGHDRDVPVTTPAEARTAPARAGAPPAAEAREILEPSTVEAEDLAGEQVYVLYRPETGGHDEGEIVEVRENAESRARG